MQYKNLTNAQVIQRFVDREYGSNKNGSLVTNGKTLESFGLTIARHIPDNRFPENLNQRTEILMIAYWVDRYITDHYNLIETFYEHLFGWQKSQHPTWLSWVKPVRDQFATNWKQCYMFPLTEAELQSVWSLQVYAQNVSVERVTTTGKTIKGVILAYEKIGLGLQRTLEMPFVSPNSFDHYKAYGKLKDTLPTLQGDLFHVVHLKTGTLLTPACASRATLDRLIVEMSKMITNWNEFNPNNVSDALREKMREMLARNDQVFTHDAYGYVAPKGIRNVGISYG